jgi:hypothetical protein
MSSSITVNNYLNTNSNHSNGNLKEPNKNSLFSSVFQEANSSEQTLIKDLHFSSRISNINESEVKDIYQQIRIATKDELDNANHKDQNLTSFDYLNGAVDKIMNYPVDVKIEWSEVNTAILYNRMGINFLDIKRIEVRMELLALASEEIERDKNTISRDKSQELVEKIDSNLNELANRKQSILDDSEAKKKGQKLLEELLFKQ